MRRLGPTVYKAHDEIMLGYSMLDNSLFDGAIFERLKEFQYISIEYPWTMQHIKNRKGVVTRIEVSWGKPPRPQVAFVRM